MTSTGSGRFIKLPSTLPQHLPPKLPLKLPPSREASGPNLGIYKLLNPLRYEVTENVIYLVNYLFGVLHIRYKLTKYIKPPRVFLLTVEYIPLPVRAQRGGMRLSKS